MLINKIFLPVIALLGILDAYLISKPNLIGKFGVWFYKYSMFKDLGSSLATVLVTLGLCVLISFFINKSNAKSGKWLLAGLVLLSILLFISVYTKFHNGSYAHTGQKFKLGMQMLPVLCFFIFGNTLAGKILNK